MIEISAISSDTAIDDWQTLEISEEKPTWKKVGDAVLLSSAFIGTCTYGLILTEKKRKVVTIPGLAIPDYQFSGEVSPYPTQAYSELPNNPKWIKELINDGLFGLYVKIYLKKEGKSIHPFKFLATIFTNAQLTMKMREIFESQFSFKQNPILAQIEQGLYENGYLEYYIDGFAREIGVLPDLLIPMIQEQDWEGLILFLLKTEPSHEEQKFPE